LTLIFKDRAGRIPRQSDYAAMVRRRIEQIDRLSGRLLNQSVSPEEWAGLFDAILFEGHTDAWVLGRQRAGDDAPRGEQDEWMGMAAKDGEAEFLNDFLQSIEQEGLSEAQVRNRARSYVAKMRHTANEAFVETGADDEQYTWVLGATEHCPDCPRLASMSPWLKSTLWTTPGGHDTDCMSGCDCKLLRIRDGRSGFERCIASDLES
jgi:hypothetical protein